MSWDEIAYRQGTDKAAALAGGGSGHGYMESYERYLGSLQVRSLLELGVDQGASLRLWSEVFPQAGIVGIDLYERKRETGRGTVAIGDASDQRFCEMVAREHGPFDVIVDDASHDPIQVEASFRALFGHLRSGGIYAIEDLYWAEALDCLAKLAHQAMARIAVVPDAVSAKHNIYGPVLMLIEAQ